MIDQEVIFSKKDIDYIKSFINYEDFLPSKIQTPYGFKLDEDIRKAKILLIDNNDLKFFIVEKLKKWNVRSISNMRFLEYNKGDFFLRHKDRVEDISDSLYRHKTIIIQLSSESDYIGGEMYVDDIMFNKDLGNLIIFDSDRDHEVFKIEEGNRLVIVLWLSVEDFSL